MKNTRQTKRDRQNINRVAGYSGSYMPLERAQSIARKQGKSPTVKVTNGIRLADQQTKRKL